MERYLMSYPGDPPVAVTRMSRAEFLAAYPRTPWVIEDLTAGTREEFPVGADEVACDLCNADPGDEVFVYGDGSRAYCARCAAECWLPHCEGAGG